MTASMTLVERLREHFYTLPEGYYNDSAYGCNWDTPESLIMAFLDSGPQGTDLLRTLTAGGYSIVKTDAVNEAADAIETAEKAVERADAENMLLHLAVNDALHWLARGQVDRVETVLRAALSKLRGNR